MLNRILGWFGYEIAKKKQKCVIGAVQVPSDMIFSFDSAIDGLKLEECVDRNLASQYKALSRNVAISAYLFGFHDGKNNGRLE